MKKDEQKVINVLTEIFKTLKTENAAFREDATKQIQAISDKVDKKHLPVFLEKDIVAITLSSIDAAVTKILSEYNSPLMRLVKEVIDDHTSELKGIICNSFEVVIRKEEFKASVVEAFSHKIARVIVSDSEGLFQKITNELRTDTVFRSKITVAVANIVEECITKKPS
jgi:hypothetical protein